MYNGFIIENIEYYPNLKNHLYRETQTANIIDLIDFFMTNGFLTDNSNHYSDREIRKIAPASARRT